MDFDKCYTGLSSEEVFVEFLHFLRSLPDLIETEKKRLIRVVEMELKIAELSSKIAEFHFKTLMNRKPSHLIDHLACTLGYSLKIVCPPLKARLLCKKGLTVNHKPSQVIVHKITGPEIYSKFLYRCRECKLSNDDSCSKQKKQDINYDVDKYGNTTTGWLLYKMYDPQDIKASNEVFLDRDFVQSYSNDLCHAWMSMEGQSESYNQTWLGSKKVDFINKFLDLNPAVGRLLFWHLAFF